MQEIYYVILLIILILIIAFIYTLAKKYQVRSKGKIIEDEKKAKKDEDIEEEDSSRIPITGKSELTINEIINAFQPYVNITGAKHISEYLHRYYSTSTKPDEQKYKEILEEILSTNSFADINDFIYKSNIDYWCFVPDNKKVFAFDLSALNIHLAETERVRLMTILPSEIDPRTFFKYNKLFKLRNSVYTHTPAEIRKSIKKDPSQVFELDLLGLAPRISYFSAPKPSAKDEKAQKETIHRIQRYLRDLGIYSDWRAYSPNITLDELEEALRRLTIERLQRIRESEYSQELERRRNEAQRKELEALRRNEEIRRATETAAHINADTQLRRDFEQQLRQDPEILNVARSLGLNDEQLFQQYKAERAIMGSAEAIESLKARLNKLDDVE